MDSKSQCSVITAYERKDGAVTVYKIVGDEVIDETTLTISRLPIVRFVGENVWIDKMLHYRGAYHFVADLLKTINYHASKIQANIALAEDANWIADKKSIASSASDWAQGSEVLVKSYDGWDDGRELPPPVQVNKSPHIAEVAQSMEVFSAMTNNILGAPNHDPVSNETAEAVLTRRAVSEASANLYLKNLKEGLKEIGRIILDLSKVVYDVPRSLKDGNIIPAVAETDGIYIEVEAGPIIAGERQKNLQQALAIHDIALKGQVPEATQKMLPLILELSDIPDEGKAFLMQQFQPQQQAIPPQVQAMMQQAEMKFAQVQQELAQANQTIQQLQNIIIAENAKVQAGLVKTQMDNETKLELEVIKQNGNDQRLQAELIADAQSDTKKVQADLLKATMKDMAQEVFNPGQSQIGRRF